MKQLEIEFKNWMIKELYEFDLTLWHLVFTNKINSCNDEDFLKAKKEYAKYLIDAFNERKNAKEVSLGQYLIYEKLLLFDWFTKCKEIRNVCNTCFGLFVHDKLNKELIDDFNFNDLEFEYINKDVMDLVQEEWRKYLLDIKNENDLICKSNNFKLCEILVETFYSKTDKKEFLHKLHKQVYKTFHELYFSLMKILKEQFESTDIKKFEALFKMNSGVKIKLSEENKNE